MKLEQSFEVGAPAETVWNALIDIERVVPCLPGAALQGRDEEGDYDGTFSVKIGPTTASYSGKLKLEQVDEAARSARLQANGTDRRGQGGARATIVSSVEEVGGGTRVDVVTDYQITGRLARFGRGGMVEDIAERLLKEFAQRLQASVGESGERHAADDRNASEASATAPPQTVQAGGQGAEPAAPSPPPSFTPQPVSEPLQGGSLIASVAFERARRNPTAVAAFVVGLLLVLAVVRHRAERS